MTHLSQGHLPEGAEEGITERPQHPQMNRFKGEISHLADSVTLRQKWIQWAQYTWDQKKNLWIKGPKCCRSIHNLRLTLWASTMPAWICPGYCDISCCHQKKSPFETKPFVKAPRGKGDSCGFCRLLLTFPKQRLTVQMHWQMWQSLCLVTRTWR